VAKLGPAAGLLWAAGAVCVEAAACAAAVAAAVAAGEVAEAVVAACAGAVVAVEELVLKPAPGELKAADDFVYWSSFTAEQAAR
jgi:hypothetical protein